MAVLLSMSKLLMRFGEKLEVWKPVGLKTLFFYYYFTVVERAELGIAAGE